MAVKEEITWATKASTLSTARAAVLAKAAHVVSSPAAEFANPITLAIGKIIAEGLGEVALSADIIDYCADLAEGSLAPQTLHAYSGAATVENS